MNHSVQQIQLSLLPQIVTAGEYALRIQNRIKSQPAKAYDNPFAQALTDADLSVQTFLEVFTLARFPELAFFGEEYEQSFNTKYFSTDGPLRILADPIDGTRYYADGRPNFNIIVSVVDAKNFHAAVVHMPGLNKCFHAVAGSGTYLATPEQIMAGQVGGKFQAASDSRAIVTYHSTKLAASLGRTFRVIDIETEYAKDPRCPNPAGVFLGEACAFIGKDCSAIDWGAQAFLLQEAGGRATDWQGNPLPPISELEVFVFPEIVASTSPEVHAEILSLVNLK